MNSSSPDPAFYPGREPGEIRRPSVRTGQIDPTDKRMGTPPDKFDAMGLPLEQDGRVSVLFCLFPPEGLRDASLDVIRQVVANSAASILETVALEIYKAYTSDPVDGTAARNIAEALTRHADGLARRQT